jgi:type II secretory pathway component PulC
LNKTKPRNRPQAVRPAAERPQPVRPKPRRTYDRINDDNLRLQALAWADDAARRMAVINGRIVHEGESVDGYQILKIREEDVIIQQSGKSWRLEFGLQH